MSAEEAPAVVIVGAGPRGLTVLERLVALAKKRVAETDSCGSSGSRDCADPGGAADSLRTAEPALVIHLIDPYPPGAGIVWRTDQPETLLMNTTIGEQTVFPDQSCDFLDAEDEPTGPSMAEWYRENGGTEPVDSTFPSRALYGRYLRDAYARIRAAAPDFIEIVEHPTTVESIIDLPPLAPFDDLPGKASVGADTGAPSGTAAAGPSGTDSQSVPPQLVRCADGTTVIALAVVLAVGHIPSTQPEERARLAAFAQRSGGLYLPQGLPAEAPLAEVDPGSRVIVRGMGLNYFDVQTLFTHERGGRFEPVAGTEAGAAPGPGELRYVPSGAEPHLALGSRRGIPYRSKPICDDHPRAPWPLRYFTNDNIALLAGLEDLDGDRKAGARFNDQLWPLILADLRFAYYRTLSEVSPEAFAGDPGQLREAIAEAVSRHLTRRTWQETHPDAASEADANRHGRVTREAFAWSEIEEGLVPDPAYRMSLHELLDPLEGREFGSREPGAADSLHEWMRDFLRSDLHDSLAGPAGSPVKSLFNVLWQSRLLLKELIAAGHIDRVSIDMEICGWFESFVSGICDGPPPQRIAELLALAEAGIVTFVGPNMRIDANEDRTHEGAAPCDTRPQIFTVTSAQVEGRVTGSVVIDAASPTNSITRAADVLMHGMLDRGQITAARLTLDDGREKLLNGLALTPRPYRTIDVEGTVHPRRFALSIQLSSMQWGLAIAANPGTNAATLSDSHAAAEAILDLL